MQPFPINYLALVVATIVKGAIGFLWYSPFLFLKPWLALSKETQEAHEAGIAEGALRSRPWATS